VLITEYRYCGRSTGERNVTAKSGNTVMLE
jgi:hypothetical protein